MRAMGSESLSTASPLIHPQAHVYKDMEKGQDGWGGKSFAFLY